MTNYVHIENKLVYHEIRETGVTKCGRSYHRTDEHSVRSDRIYRLYEYESEIPNGVKKCSDCEKTNE